MTEPSSTSFGQRFASVFWDELVAVLQDPACFATLNELDPYEVLRAWAALEENSPHRVVDAYAYAISNPEAGVAYGPGLAELLDDREFHKEADALLRRLVAHSRERSDAQRLANALGDFVRTNFGDDTRSVNEERLRLAREIGDVGAQAEALGHEAWSRWLDGLLDDDPSGEGDSRRLLQEQRYLCRRHGDKRGSAQWADAAAWLLYCDGYPDPMPRLFAMEERLCRECGDLRLLCQCLLQRSRLLRVSTATQADAWAKMLEAEAIARDLGLRRMVDAALTDQGVTALLERDEQRALHILSGVRPRPASGGSESTLETALAQALRFPDDGHPGAFEDHGRRFAAMAERVARDLGDAGAVQWALGRLASELEDSDAAAALAAHEEREVICRDLGRGLDLQETLREEAALLVRLHEPIQAVAVLKDAVHVCGEYDLEWCIDDLRRAQRDALRAALHECGDAKAAIALQAQLELVLRWLHDKAGASKAVRDRARLLRMLHRRSAEALPVDPAQLSLGF